MIRDLDLFDIDLASPLSRITGEFFERGYQDISRLLNDAVAATIFSAEGTKEIDHLQDLMFLYLYLYLLHWQRSDEKEKTGSFPTRESLYLDFDLDAVRKYFACNFIEIIPLLETFDTSLPSGSYDGIGYMFIQPGDNPTFRVS